MLTEFDHLFKVVIVGPAGAGKTQLLSRYIGEGYTTSYVPTIGADFKVKDFEVNEKLIKLQFWDTAGQERFSCFKDSSYQGAHAFIVACDLTATEETFKQQAQKILNDITSFTSSGAKIILVGTKNDTESKFKAKNLAHLSELASDKQYVYMTTSAKEGIGVKGLFENQLVPMLLNTVTPFEVVEPPKTATFNKSLKHTRQSPILSNTKQQSGSNYWRYGLALLVALGVAAILVIPGVGQAFGLSAAIGYLVVNTALQLGLFAAGAALVSFCASCSVGYILNKLNNPWRYSIALLLGLGIAATLVIPGIGQAFGLSTAIGYLVVNTALQLGLFAAGAGLLTFAASCTFGYALDKTGPNSTWFYGASLLLALGVAAILVIPVVGQTFGLSAAIGYLVVNTPLQLGLLAAGAALVTFGFSWGLGFIAHRPQRKPNSAYTETPSQVPSVPRSAVKHGNAVKIGNPSTVTPVFTSPFTSPASGRNGANNIPGTQKSALSAAAPSK